MAAGDLSPDQARYRDRFVARSGLHPVTVTAWIGAESGWNVTKAGHNYLNVGPGRTFQSADAAADAAASLISNDPRYGGIRAVRGDTPKGQAEAIVASPWGTGPTIVALAEQLDPGGGRNPLEVVGDVLEDVAGAPGSIAREGAEALAEGAGRVVSAALDKFLLLALGLVFSLAALALVGLGLARLTGRDAGDVTRTLLGATGAGAALAS